MLEGEYLMVVGPPWSSNMAAGKLVWTSGTYFDYLGNWFSEPSQKKHLHKCTFVDKRDLSFMSRTAITSLFKTHWLANEGRYCLLSWKAVNRYKSSTTVRVRKWSQDRKRSRTGNDPHTGPQMIPIKK